MQSDKESVNSTAATVSKPEKSIQTTETAPEEEVFTTPKRKKRGFVLSSIAIILVVALAVYLLNPGGSRSAAATGGNYTDYTVGTRDITLSLSGTGSLQPADSYTVTTLISGEILSSPFEEGDIVEKDHVLYTVDSSDVSTGIEQAEISLAQSQRSYNQKVKSLEDLTIKANETGKVAELLVDPGDKVTAGQTVARIRNSTVMSLVIPFGSDDAAGFFVGQSAQVTLDGSFEQIAGTISKISATEERLEGNMLVRRVTIDVPNPGGIALDQAATAMVGDIACNGNGTFSYKAESTVTAGASGEVSKVHIKEGGHVRKDQEIITLTNDTLSQDVANSGDSLRNSELNLQNRYDQLDNYTIKSPIAGTIIEKNYKEGDTLESGKPLCTIFDLSYLTMTLNVDELDVAQVEVGQTVSITAEALEGQSYEGVVTKININGTTANGVTSYPVTIRIDETDGLLPGMNVQASIVVTSKTDVIAIPVSALSRGNRVLVKTGGLAASTGGGNLPEISGRPEGGKFPEGGSLPEGGNFPEGGSLPEGGNFPEGGTLPEGGNFPNASNLPQGGAVTEGIPEGFAYVRVTPGISDGAYIEITSGLKVGDIIAIPEEVIPESSQFGFGPMGGGNVTVVQGGPGGNQSYQQMRPAGGMGVNR